MKFKLFNLIHYFGFIYLDTNKIEIFIKFLNKSCEGLHITKTLAILIGIFLIFFKIRPSLTTSKEGLIIHNLHSETTRI